MSEDKTPEPEDSNIEVIKKENSSTVFTVESIFKNDNNDGRMYEPDSILDKSD